MSSDPRRHPPPPPSSSLSQPRQQPGDDHSDLDSISWLDFLRTAGGTVPADRDSSADRKRRHVGSSPERRSNPHLPAYSGRRSSTMDSSGSLGSTREHAIDLTSPPRQQPPAPPRSSGGGSSENVRSTINTAVRPQMANLQVSFSGSDIVLPRWQSDTEVDRCPVCQTDFSFWYRKHHCRKCGRVVCAACSPHRITIPRQYIVQPPNFSDVERSPTSPTRNSVPRNLGGGEVVRVCNPCVPDPWTPDAFADASPRGDRIDRNNASASQRVGRQRPPPPPPPFEHDRARSQAGPNLSRSLPQGQGPPNFIFRDPYMRHPPPPPPNHIRTNSNRHGPSHWTAAMQPSSPPPLLPSTRPPLAPPPPPPQSRPRREVREEDECPVCGTELPPGDRLRESHIQECIAARFSSTPSSSSAPAAPPRVSSMAAQTSTSVPHAPSPSMPSPGVGPNNTDASARPRATSYRPRGMAIYRATEKDCVSEDGEAQECVICFEEFQPGDEMGRMECLCKFHRACIRSWWERKGTGVCPTHMLHD